MTEVETLNVNTREAWRAWLARHHASASEVWLRYAKRHTGEARVEYDAAVEEALCFGWIDGLVRTVDDRYYAQRFTPRRAGSKWSAINRRRFARLVREGRVTKAGLAKSPPPEPTTADDSPARSEPAPSYRRLYLRWIAEAKREETRTRRIEKAIGLLAAGKKPGLK